VPSTLAIVLADTPRAGEPLWLKTDAGVAAGLDVRWTLGEVGTAAGPSASVVWPQAGRVNVSVTVTDSSGGRVSATREIEVLPPPDPMTPRCSGASGGGWCLVGQRPPVQGATMAFASTEIGVAVSSEQVSQNDLRQRSAIQRSTDGGKTWVSLEPLAPSNFDTLASIHVVSPQAMFILPRFGDAPAQRSIDGGRTWQPLALPDAFRGRLDGGVTVDAALDASQLIVRGSFGIRGNRLVASYATETAGLNWTAVPHNASRMRLGSQVIECVDGVLQRRTTVLAPPQALPIPRACLVVTPGDDERSITVISSGNVYLASRDGGQVWTELNTTDAGEASGQNLFGVRLFGDKGWAFSQRAGDPALLRTLRTVDFGKRWRVLSGPGSDPGQFFVVDGDTAWSTEASGSKIQVTHDGAASWFGSDLQAVLEPPMAVQADGSWIAVTRGLSGSRRHLRSLDRGLSWTAVRREPVRPQGALVMLDRDHGLSYAGRGVLLETRDGGTLWTERKALPIDVTGGERRMALLTAPGGTVWVVDQGGMFRSADAGGTWAEVALPDGLRGRVDQLFWSTAQRGWALAATCGDLAGASDRCTRSLWTTGNAGANWQPIPAAGDAGWWIAADAAAVLLGRSDGSVWRSADQGMTWQRAQTPPSPSRALTLQALGEVAWLISGEGRLWRSTDRGLTWRVVALPDGASAVSDLRFADPTRGWVRQGRQLWRTDDGGAGWIEQSPALETALGTTPEHGIGNLFVLDAQTAYLPSPLGVLRTYTAGH
jgi:photosystem II stability/assembly factor-like uncharacterized protein